MQRFPHLHEDLREVIDQYGPVRIDHLHIDRWIDYPRALEALETLEALLKTPPRTRMPCLLLYGDSGMGKTMIIEKLRRAHRPKFDSERRTLKLDIIAIQMPAKPSEARVYAQILKAIGAPTRPNERLAVLEPITLALLHKIKPRMLVVDEVHNLLAGAAREQRIALNLLKFLANDLSCSIVALGTRDAQIAMQTDSQIASRFRPLELTRWRNDPILWRFLRAYEKLLPLRLPSQLSQPALARLIVDRSDGITGEITEILTRAAEIAIRRGDERITEGNLSMAYPRRFLHR